jgi:hypothetical protein
LGCPKVTKWRFKSGSDEEVLIAGGNCASQKKAKETLSRSSNFLGGTAALISARLTYLNRQLRSGNGKLPPAPDSSIISLWFRDFFKIDRNFFSIPFAESCFFSMERML